MRDEIAAVVLLIASCEAKLCTQAISDVAWPNPNVKRASHVVECRQHLRLMFGCHLPEALWCRKYYSKTPGGIGKAYCFVDSDGHS